MFMSFIDSKIMSHWEALPANLRVFEERIQRVRGERHDQRFRRYSRGLSAKEAGRGRHYFVKVSVCTSYKWY